MTTKKILLFFQTALFICVSAGALESVYRLDASTSPASSPTPWSFEGVAAVPSSDGSLVMALEPAEYRPDSETDLLVHFDGDIPIDETGRWRLEPHGSLTRAPSDRAYMGSGAASFRAPGSQLTMFPDRSSLFGSNALSRDFSIEFWLYPANAESGEILLLWKGARRDGARTTTQQVSVIVSRNHLMFAFTNFFAAPDGGPSQINLTGTSLLVPRTWSHHLVRFDSSTGLLEYLINGITEATAYATRTGREGGAALLPSVGTASPVYLGTNYTGLMDELRISSRWIEKPVLGRYGLDAGRATSPIVDLGWANTELKSIDVQIRTPGDSGASFFFRIGDSPETWQAESPAWRPFTPGAALPEDARGRYAQIRVELYPDPRGGSGPVLSSLALRYVPDLPSPPPGEVLALPGNGSITLRWSRVPDADLRGYLVYYGYAPGEYYGNDSTLGPSPIDAGDAISLTLKGLTNGRLYYFVIASYDALKPRRPGEFSEEISARPSRTAP